MTSEIFISRREKLISSLNDNELVLIFGAEDAHGVNRFLQNSHFFYFTGLNTPDAVLVMGKTNGKNTEMVFVEKNIPERIVWDGEKMKPEEVTAKSGIKRVNFLEDFEQTVCYYLFNADKAYANIGLQSLNKPLTKPLLFIQKVQAKIPHIAFRDISNLIRPLRQIKDETEIAAITESIKITWAGIESILKNAKAGMFEYQLEAMLHFEMQKLDCRNYGFTPIVAGGKNAATLHYSDNNREIKDGEMVLLDVGAAKNNYSADITRVFPVNGKFSDRQKAVYSEVLAIQKVVIAIAKPGVPMADLNKKTVELMFSALKRLGLITEEKEVSKYYMHGVSHHLGLDTHDVGAPDTILAPGMVFTVEPGIYIPEENIGVRIEDDVLITADGYRVLSDFIPKEISEIEALRA